MNSSLYNAVSGLTTYQKSMDVWSNNIANVNTVGFREQLVDFQNMISSGNGATYTGRTIGSPVVQSDIGLGGAQAVTVMDTKQGSLKTTDNVFDLAIEGKGFFQVLAQNGEQFYTRTGTFLRDNTGTLVNSNGEKLLGFNPKTLTQTANGWTYNSKIDTSKINKSTTTEPLVAPEDVIFPADPSKKISLGGNLNDSDLADNVKPMSTNSDLGVAYNRDYNNINLKSGQNSLFGFGDNIKYDSGLIKIDNCITNDEVDGNPVDIDFDVNGENIKLTLPDGSTKSEIVDAVAKALDNKNILYDKTDAGIQIKAENKLKIKHNNGDFFPTASAKILTYESQADTTKGQFTTIKDFIDQIQTLANDVYPNTTNVGLDKKGEIYIENNSDKAITATSQKANNTNDKFFDNLDRLGNVINPRTSSKSLVFNHSYEGFTGNIIDSDGNKNDLKFDFIKSKVTQNTTTWHTTITEKLPDGTVVSTKEQDMVFDKQGGLLTPTNLEFNNNGTKANIDFGGNFRGLTSFAKPNIGFQYSQDGLLEGHLKGYDIDSQGEIIASFSNGKDGVIGAIPLFNFQNEQGLDSVGGQNYTPTVNSGKALLYKDNQGNYILDGNIKNYALENSNVSMSKAMTELIVMQKAFASNAKSMTTSDQMIQKAIDMKR